MPILEGGPAYWLPPAGPLSETAATASPSQQNWVRISDEAVETATMRSYDYFAELDEKLALLHQVGNSGEGAL